MSVSRATLAILAPPGPVRDGLEALCAALPSFHVLPSFADWESALGVLPTLEPDLIVLDAAFVRTEPDLALAQLQAAAPDRPRLVLVDEVHQLANASPGETRLLKGASAADLVAVLHRLLGLP